MKKNIAVVLLIIYLFVFTANISLAESFWEDIGRENLDLKTFLLDLDAPEIIFIGSKRGIFKSEDAGRSWRSLLLIRAPNREINLLVSDILKKDSLYAATGNGLYYSRNKGETWERIFRGKNHLQNDCVALGVLTQKIYLGTKGGLFFSQDKGRSWHRETGKVGNVPVSSIAYSHQEPSCIYVACIDGLFRSQDAGKSWSRIFLATGAENDKEAGDSEENSEEIERNMTINYVSCDPNNPGYIYLATNRGVYQSKDRGESWESMPGYGLFDREVKSLLISRESVIYAATKSGIFEYRSGHWEDLSSGLAAGEARSLGLDREGNLYAVCDRGLFRRNKNNSIAAKQDKLIPLYCKNEPDISEIQEAAVEYAEVQPQKIAEWRRRASIKAWLPEVSVGLNRDAGDLWHWETGSSTKIDDDVLRRGKEIVDWDVALSWDLGELVWNNDQTSIDARSRLMVQLRDDILDEVTKLYFERLRVRIELDNLSIEDRKKRMEKELKVRELTASLDALTGGYFSRQLTN